MAWGALLTLRQGPKEALGAHQTLICHCRSLGSGPYPWFTAVGMAGEAGIL